MFGLLIVMSALLMTWSTPTALAAEPNPLKEPPRFSVQLVPRICEAKIGGCDICDIVLIFTNVANIVGGALGGMALLMFIVGGFMFIFSSGNEQRIETGRKILTGTVVGVLIVFLAWMGVNYIVRTVYYAGYNAGGVKAGSGASQPKLFSQDWWAPTCSPDLTPCFSKSEGAGGIGAQCGASGDCASDKKSTACVCYREKLKLEDKTTDNPTDTGKCGGTTDATAVTAVTGPAGQANADTTKEGKQQCYCSNSCNFIAAGAKPTALTGYTVQCIDTATYESNSANYFKLQYSCENAQQICVANIE